MIQINGYSTKEIQARAGVTRDAVSKWAKEYEWSVSKIGNANIYDASDVDAFFPARLRRNLMQAAGWTKSAKLIWSDTWDRDCECGGFAVERPAKIGEEQTEKWLAGEIDLICVNCGLMPQKG